MPVDVGQGSSISFGTTLSGSAGYKLTNISWSGASRNVADASHMLTVGGKEYLSSQIYDPGELTAEILFDPAIKPWADFTNVSSTQAVVVAFANGGTNTAAWSCYGYISGFEASAPVDDMMTGTVTIKLHGNVS